jgi:hypothetical protein
MGLIPAYLMAAGAVLFAATTAATLIYTARHMDAPDRK